MLTLHVRPHEATSSIENNSNNNDSNPNKINFKYTFWFKNKILPQFSINMTFCVVKAQNKSHSIVACLLTNFSGWYLEKTLLAAGNGRLAK